MRKKVDYIIIGQGLAGSSVAMHLLERGKKIMVFDDPYPNSASKIAAGLFNPITGKNMVKTWLADETFSYLHEYYTTVETATNAKFYYPKGIFHPFKRFIANVYFPYPLPISYLNFELNQTCHLYNIAILYD